MHNEENTEAVTMESVLQRENLKAAWRAVKANRGAAGVDGMGIEETHEHLREHWDGIAEKLMAGTYQPAAVRAVEIPKAQGGVRVLGIPNVQDRLIQQAIHQKLSPMWEAVRSANTATGSGPGAVRTMRFEQHKVMSRPARHGWWTST